ncbi:MAG: formyl transferase [Pseudomonadota bacterium]
MRILVCAKNDLPANLACNRLCQGLDDADLTFWLSDITRPAEQSDGDLTTMRLFERDLPNRWLFPLIEKGPARPNDAYLTFPELARRHNAALSIVPSLRDDDAETTMRELAPDLVISIRFSHIFPESLIRIPRHGILNIHPGRLPEYAGLYAPFRQMLDGRGEIGCTVHWIDRGIDTGPVVSRGTVPIDRARSLIWHVCHAYTPGVDEVLHIVHGLKEGRQPSSESQNTSRRTYHRLPRPTEFQDFRDRGFRLIDFDDYDGLLQIYRADTTDMVTGIDLHGRPKADGSSRMRA